MQPIFEIFKRYRARVIDNYGFALASLKEEPDFSVDEVYEFDRSEAEWPQDKAEMQEIWRKRTKNDMLNLILADPDMDWTEAADTLTKRYERFLKRINGFDADDVMEGFMNSFTRTLDPHSSYMSPQRSEEYDIQMSLSYQGIGASLKLEDELVTILNIIPGGPAAIDGKLQPEDRIVAVGQEDDDELVDVVGWMLDDVVQKIRGPANTTVRLLVRPANATPGEEYLVSIVRNKIKLEEQAAKSDVIEIERHGKLTRLGVITVPGFYQDFKARSNGEANYNSTTRDVKRLIEEFEEQDQQIDGLVLDLRSNGGGHLSEATALSGLFIPNGPVVQLRYTNGRIEVYEDPEPDVAYDGPLVVLVNRFSASASEIFAAVIQDYNRGLVIGQQTFGKGTVQSLIVLDRHAPRSEHDGLGNLILTSGKYYRVTGESTQNRGVMPDIELPSLVDVNEIGENTKPHALPWDKIKPTRFRALTRTNKDLSRLTEEQLARAKADPDFQYLLDEIELVEELRDKQTLSLNLEVRKQEQEARKAARLARENARRMARGLQPVDSIEDIDAEEQADVLLNGAAEILTDLVSDSAAGKAVLSRSGDA
jgi:carboxyl-terminal processing protease